MSALDWLLPWDSQPQELAEICQDYSPAFIWNPAIGLLVPALGSPLSASGTITGTAGQHGRAASLASSAYLTRANYAPIVTSDGVWTGDFTAFVIANPSASANPRALLSQRLDGGALSQVNIQANANSAFAGESGTVQFATYSTAATVTSATGIIDGNYHVFGIRRVGTTVTGWVDGVQVATVTGTVRAIGSASAGFGVGIAPPIYNILGAVDIAFAAGFNAGIVDMAAVSRNMWRATFAPRSIQMPVSAGGDTTISGALGTATASGHTGTVNANRTIAGALGTASASGLQGAVNANTTIAGALGSAVASGLSGTVSNTNDTVIGGTLGIAIASGLIGTVNANRTISGSLGTAVASGLTGTVSNGTTTDLALILKILSNRQELNATTGKFTLYDDDGVTVLYESDAWEDTAGTIPYRGKALRRIDALA